MNKSVFIISLSAVLFMSSCASKKDLENCQNENRELTRNYQDAKEQLAANKARISSLEDQLAQQKKDYAALQSSLDKSLSNASQNNVSIEKLVDQINESDLHRLATTCSTSIWQKNIRRHSTMLCPKNSCTAAATNSTRRWRVWM